MLLSTDFWVGALLRRIEQGGGFGYIAQKGDAKAGGVIIKVINLMTRQGYLLREAQTQDGAVWMRPIKTDDELEIDNYLQKQMKFDPDLWVVEIEDREGRHFLTEKVEDL
ncbi:DUF1491 family protein [Asticcacaulis machinosus]|uniref:DUF1491 family protein n=1 Tax=Asticcacaulis machinosus TaxID=2984211 RepID=A0ABT5HIX5_9CAUL|nr:DUF1491 family protein [Asticcacaulis machinosus]